MDNIDAEMPGRQFNRVILTRLERKKSPSGEDSETQKKAPRDRKKQRKEE